MKKRKWAVLSNGVITLRKEKDGTSTSTISLFGTKIGRAKGDKTALHFIEKKSKVRKNKQK